MLFEGSHADIDTLDGVMGTPHDVNTTDPTLMHVPKATVMDSNVVPVPVGRNE